MMILAVDPRPLSYLDVLQARSQDLPPPTSWNEWGEPFPRVHLICICGRAEVRPGEALCSRCDGPD